MTRSSSSVAEWEHWEAQAWGRALFRYYFVAIDGDTRPVSRLAVSSEELARACGANEADAPAAREAFLASIWCPPREFRKHLSHAALVHGKRPADGPPPYFVYLLFTCFAAASIDEDTVNQGVFRHRLRLYLEHPQRTSYKLTDLPDLWRALERWLDERRRAGAPYRALVLPDPGSSNLVGHSLRLAFPSRTDRQKLMGVIRQADCEAVPSVPEVLRLIGRELHQFSVDFRDVFLPARQAFAQGRTTPELHALWSAIVEAAHLVAARPAEGSARTRYQLFLQEDEQLQSDLVLLMSAERTASRKDAVFSELEEPLGEYRFIVRLGAEESTTRAATQLLNGSLSALLSDLRSSPVARTVEDGVLLFRPHDPITWALSVARPYEGAVRALVLERLLAPFLSLFPPAERPRGRESKFDGWIELGPFDATALGPITFEHPPALAGIRCLQATRIGLQITLADGVRIDGGYLGLKELLPTAHCPGAQSVELVAVGAASGGRHAPLVAQPDVNSFVFDPGVGDLEGLFTLVASEEGEAVGSRNVVFHSRVLEHEYKTSGSTTQWIVEASDPAALSPFEATNEYLSTELERVVGPAWKEAKAFEYSAGHYAAEGAEPFSLDDDPRLDRFAESLAALATNRTGISESELLDLVSRMIGAEGSSVIWDVVRAWVEAGYLDVAARRRWRGRVYFARRPRLVVTRLEPQPVVTLHGLAPYRLRARARAVFEDIGATSTAGHSVSRFVGAPPAWTVESVEAATIAAAELKVGPLQFVRSPAEFGTPLSRIADATVDQLLGYESRGIWDWDEGGFRSNRPTDTTMPVVMDWRTRPDRPDLFVVRREDICWSTHIRNWAVLLGYYWANKRGFGALGRSMLARVDRFSPYVPLPTARAIALRSGITSGPTDRLGDDWRYVYYCSTHQERRQLLQQIQGVEDGRAEQHLRWVLSALSHGASTGDVVPIPADLLRRLRELNSPGNLTRRSLQRIPRRMLPHLRQALLRVGV